MQDMPRLAALPVPAKVTLTAFVALVSAGYLVAVGNIYLHHGGADGKPGMSIDDIRAVYRGLDRPAAGAAAPSPMLRMVRPDGAMRKHLDKGGEADARSLIAWLEAGASRDGFAKAGASAPGDPSPLDVIARSCVRCHNEGGKKRDVPYAKDAASPPAFELVSAFAAPPAAGVVRVGPKSIADLVQVTHVHIISIPLFALAMGALFLLARPGPRALAILLPLPMLAAVADVSSWWLARAFDPFVYVIGAAGAVFGTSLALQAAWVLAALWLGRREPGTPVAGGGSAARSPMSAGR